MSYKIIQEAPEQKKYCDYVQKKFDIARQYNARYEIGDEDLRIQALYDNPNLKPVENVKSIARVKKVEDGAECIVVTKTVRFVDKITGATKDRYNRREGLIELPLKVTNEEGATEASQLKLEYDIPFSKAKVMEYVKQAGGKGVTLKFYEGPETGNRVIRNTQVVGNLKYFTEASWEELLLGKEMGLVSSRINRLDEVRESIPKQQQQEDSLGTETTTLEETNKIETTNKNIDVGNNIEKGEIIPNEVTKTQKTGTGTGGTGGIKLKISNNPDKKD